jgi:hypothetical protein
MKRQNMVKRLKAGSRRLVALAITTTLLAFVACVSTSCHDRGNATEQERRELAAAVNNYWNSEKFYSLGFTNAVGELISANVQGNQAEVVVEIILGYTQPTDGASYKNVTFRLHKQDGAWKVTYDGWIDKELN